MKKTRISLFIIIFILVFTYIILDKFVYKEYECNKRSDGNHELIVNGHTYIEKGEWFPLERGTHIGYIEGEPFISKVFREMPILGSGVYEVKNDVDHKFLIVRLFFSEFKLQFCRKDLILPKPSFENTDGIEILEYNKILHKRPYGENAVRDKDTIKEFYDILYSADNERRYRSDFVSMKSIYIYSDDLPGAAYIFYIYEYNYNRYVVSSRDHKIMVEMQYELLLKLKG